MLLDTGLIRMCRSLGQMVCAEKDPSNVVVVDDLQILEGSVLLVRGVAFERLCLRDCW